MMRIVIKIAITLLVAVQCCGCLSLRQPARDMFYYTLEYAAPAPAEPDTADVLIKVRKFTAAPDYNTRRIIYRDASFARNSYNYHKWMSYPEDMVGALMTRDLLMSQRFSAVIDEQSPLFENYALEGYVEEFYGLNNDDGWSGVLSIRFTLSDSSERSRVLLQKSYLEKVPCLQQNPQALAAAFSGALEKISAQLIDDVYSVLKPLDQ